MENTQRLITRMSLPRGWFLAKGENGFWVVYDANLEPQTVGKSARGTVSEAVAFAHRIGIN